MMLFVPLYRLEPLRAELDNLVLELLIGGRTTQSMKRSQYRIEELVVLRNCHQCYRPSKISDCNTVRRRSQVPAIRTRTLWVNHIPNHALTQSVR